MERDEHGALTILSKMKQIEFYKSSYIILQEQKTIYRKVITI